MDKLAHIILIIALTLALSACKKDASVLLAECIGDAHKELLNTNQRTITNSCNVGLNGAYLVVLYPAINLNDKELKNYGLDDREIRVLRSLQFPQVAYESIYIIPLEDQELPSRTTSQGGMVNIPNFISVKKGDPVLAFTLEWAPDGIKIVSLQ